MYAAHRIPIGTPSKIAPRVPANDVRIKGRIPYFGSEEVGDQTFPDINLKNPISLIAGKPDTVKNTVMIITKATERKPYSVKISRTIFSNKCFFFISFYRALL